MILYITDTEIEVIILQRIASGNFQSPEQVLLDALKTSPSHPNGQELPDPPFRSGEDIVAAMQASPYKEVDLGSAGFPLQVREVAF